LRRVLIACRYQGVLGACVGLGNTVGPFVAAAFTHNVTWRATFWFIAPLAVCVAGFLSMLLPGSAMPKESAKEKLLKVDWSGIVLSSAGTIIILIPVSGIHTQFEPASAMSISMMTIGAILLVLFLLNEWKFAKLPMFPLRLFKNHALAAMLAQNLLIGIVFYSLLYYLPIYYQSARQMSITASAALILPLVIAQSIASILSGQYISRMGRYGEVIWLGYACWTLGAGLHLLFSRSSSTVGIVFVLIVEGFGVGLVFQPTLVAAQAHSAKSDRAVVISARNFIRAFGGSVGLSIASPIYSNALFANLPPTLPEKLAAKIKASVFDMPDTSNLGVDDRAGLLDAYADAARAVFYLWLAAIAICLVLMVFIKDTGLHRKEEEVVEKASGETTPADQRSQVLIGEKQLGQPGEV
jgi:MFS family permease